MNEYIKLYVNGIFSFSAAIMIPLRRLSKRRTSCKSDGKKAFIFSLQAGDGHYMKNMFYFTSF